MHVVDMITMFDSLATTGVTVLVRVPSQPYSETDLFDSSDKHSPETEIVPIPFPFRFQVKVDGDPIDAKKASRQEYRRRLDFRKGVYFEDNLLESVQGKKNFKFSDLFSFRPKSLDPTDDIHE